MRTAAGNAATDAEWSAVLRGDRDAFRALVMPYLGDLCEAARHELDYRRALGDLEPDDPTQEELVGDVLTRAWQDRQRRPPNAGLKPWLLAVLFRVVATHVRHRALLNALPTVSLEQPVPPEPIYDDDESFWEWYQPDELTRWEDVVDDTAATPEAVAAADEDLTRALDPRAREILLMSDFHGVGLPEAAAALGLPIAEAGQLLAEARRHIDDVARRRAPS